MKNAYMRHALIKSWAEQQNENETNNNGKRQAMKRIHYQIVRYDHRLCYEMRKIFHLV